MKTVINSPLWKTVLIVLVISGLTTFSRQFDNQIIKTLIGVLNFILILSILSINKISSSNNTKEFVSDLQNLILKHWGKLVMIFLFIGFIENYKDVKRGFVDGWKAVETNNQSK